MFCEKCGAKLPDGAKFCGSCGETTEAGADREQPSSSIPPAPTAPQPPRQDYYVPQQPSGQAYGSEPLSVGQYVGMFLLMAIPLVNIILMFVWGFGSEANLNRKNYARAMLIMAAIGIVLWIICVIAFGSLIAAFGDMFESGSYYSYY